MSGSINEAEGTRSQRGPSAFSHWCRRLGPLLVAIVALLVIRPSLDAVGELPSDAEVAAPDAPGLTLDEIFNIQTGAYLWRSLVLEGPSYFTPSGADRVFKHPLANPDHPPLGRLAIGAAHDLLRPLLVRTAPEIPYSVLSARYASVLMFAVTVWLVGSYAARWYGAIAGVVASLSLVLMPRAFGHAHLAALETAIGLTFTWTVLYVADRWTANIVDRPPSALRGAETSLPAWMVVTLAGVLLGLALLTKIQAILLPIPIGLWACWQWRWRAIPRMLVFGVVGVAVFFLGWPWLWLDPLGHTLQYLGRTTDRPTLYCYYLGQRFADVDVPWHYSGMMFLATVPVGLHVLGFWGLWRRVLSPWTAHGSIGHDPRISLIAGVLLFALMFFALPGITVYDGDRLFLVVFPLWSVLVGAGASTLQSGSAASRIASAPGQSSTDAVAQKRPGPDGSRLAGQGRERRLSPSAVTVALLAVAGIGEGVWGLVTLHPCHLSYYNLAVRGLSGADHCGFEPTYWRDSFTRRFLDDVAQAVPPGSMLYIAPVLHPANRIDLPLLSPILQQHGLQTDAYDNHDPTKAGMRYVLVFRRHADPWASLEPAPPGAQLLCEVRRHGVQLAACYDLGGE